MKSIVQKILDGDVKLEDLTLEEFNKDRKVYPTAKKACASGYEAEHIHTAVLQIRRYNELHGTDYKSSDRKRFTEETGCFDDSCYRMTTLEHIVNHYLKAKKDPEEAEVFSRMLSYNQFKLSDVEKITLDNCIDFAKLREEGRKLAGNRRKGIPYKHKGKTMKEITGNPDFVSSKKGKTIQEITGNPNYVNPLKGKTVQEITHNPNYVSPSLGKTMKEITGNPDWVDSRLGKTKAEIVGDPNYVSPRLGKKNTDYNPNYVNKCKGKTMKEITGNPNYVDPKLGKTMKEILNNPDWEYKWKGKTMAEKTGNPNFKVWNKGKPDPIAKKRNLERYSSYKKEKEEGIFTGSWNEYQHLCKIKRLEN